jgi:hypothetical protein
MGERGKELLKAIGEGGADDETDEEEVAESDGQTAAAESLCRALDIPEEKAGAVARALRSFFDNC